MWKLVHTKHVRFHVCFHLDDYKLQALVTILVLMSSFVWRANLESFSVSFTHYRHEFLRHNNIFSVPLFVSLSPPNEPFCEWNNYWACCVTRFRVNSYTCCCCCCFFFQKDNNNNFFSISMWHFFHREMTTHLSRTAKQWYIHSERAISSDVSGWWPTIIYIK